MIYAIFLCQLFVGHPDAGGCQMNVPNIYSSKEDCEDELAVIRRDDAKGDSHIEGWDMFNGIKRHVYFACMGKPTWTQAE